MPQLLFKFIALVVAAIVVGTITVILIVHTWIEHSDYRLALVATVTAALLIGVVGKKNSTANKG